jgi:hypothetical protein
LDRGRLPAKLLHLVSGIADDGAPLIDRVASDRVHDGPGVRENQMVIGPIVD